MEILATSVIKRVTDYRRGNPGVEKISARSTLPLPVKTF